MCIFEKEARDSLSDEKLEVILKDCVEIARNGNSSYFKELIEELEGLDVRTALDMLLPCSNNDDDEWMSPEEEYEAYEEYKKEMAVQHGSELPPHY
ncbi:hypothetical protein D4R99_03945 [bacterium]|nr:MAG: hypothetical protein D4R99_03945 [bacterium]